MCPLHILHLLGKGRVIIQKDKPLWRMLLTYSDPVQLGDLVL